MLGRVPAGTLTLLADTTSTVPQTYLVTADVLGWQNRAAGVVCITCVSARLLGAIDPKTGVETTGPAKGARDYSAEFARVSLLATTSSRVREQLKPGVQKLQIVLMPAGGGATFVLDRVVR